MTMPRAQRYAAPLAALALVGTLVSACSLTGGEKEDAASTVTAVFTDAMPIVEGNDVKASGVDVGTVKSVTLKDGHAEVEMEIDEELRPLHDDASATITSKNILGERFVEIDTGTADSPVLESPAVIGIKQTRREVDLQEVLNAVDTPSSKALGALLTSLGEGMRGQGKTASAAMKALVPAMEQSGELATILNEQNDLLTSLVDNAQPVASALAGNRGEEMDHLVESLTQTLGSVSAERVAVRETLQQLPSTMTQARRTLSRLSGVADPTTKNLRSLRPLTGDLSDVSAELKAFSDAADPALASLQPVLSKGELMIDEAAPLVRALSPAGTDLRKVSRSGRQLADKVLGDHLTHLMEFMKGWALATSDYDAISHYFKAMLPVSPSPLGRTLTGPLPGAKDDPLGGLPIPGAKDEKAGPTDPPVPDGPLSDLLGNKKKQKPRDSATGLTPQQENSLIDQLLGGQ